MQLLSFTFCLLVCTGTVVKAFAPGISLRGPSLQGRAPALSRTNGAVHLPPFSLGAKSKLPSLGVATRTAFKSTGISSMRMLGNLFGGGEDVAVCKVQIALNCDSRGPKSVLGTISRCADEVDTECEDSLSDFVSDVTLALLRKDEDWISGKVEYIQTKSEEDAEEEFGQYSLKERTKIERETVNRVKGRDRSDDRAQEGKLEDIGKPTSAVVTIILALYGKMDTKVTDSASMRKFLSDIGSSVTSSDTLLAAEVMWTPEEAWEVMDEEEVILDYPDFVPF